MINLLPNDVKTSYYYARRNVSLRKWVIAFMFALIGLGVLATFGLLTVKQSTAQHSKEITQTETTFKQEQFAETQKRVQEMSSNFKLVVKVLSQEVLFSQLLHQVATTIPAKASLTGLTISQVQGAIDISAVAIDYKTATQVQVNLSDPANKIFSKADIISINCDTQADSTNKAKYPCAVSIRALFAPNNPFLLINSKGTKP